MCMLARGACKCDHARNSGSPSGACIMLPPPAKAVLCPVMLICRGGYTLYRYIPAYLIANLRGIMCECGIIRYRFGRYTGIRRPLLMTASIPLHTYMLSSSAVGCRFYRCVNPLTKDAPRFSQSRRSQQVWISGPWHARKFRVREVDHE